MLEVNHLSVHYKTSNDSHLIKAVDNVSFSINPGEILGIAGESGSGKSQTAMAIMGLLPKNALIEGSVRFLNREIMNLPLEKINQIRGSQITMIFQDPMTALNPYLTIASQMTEVLMLHEGKTYKESLKIATDLLDLTRIPEANDRIHRYPHEFSGGMRQRVMIAMGLLCHPKLLIADEPTTALDVTTQAQILHILKDLQRDFNMAILIITHDMGVMARIADRVQVFYQGQLIETGDIDTIFYSPQHQHTKELLDAVRLDISPQAHNQNGEQRSPLYSQQLGFRCGASEAGEEVYTEYMTEADGARNNTENSSAKSILTIKDLSIHFPIKKSWFQAPEILKAVSNVDFNVYEGEILGIVGESGCGKSTLARAIVGLNTITQGDIIFTGNQSLSQLTEKEWHPLRQSIQLIFQDPIASLNPRINILDVIAEPLKIYHPHLSHTEIVQQATDIIKAVGLEEEHLYRYPQEFSGGQCQRINIARALILKPSLLICDEATSALDATTKLQIIDLLKNLKQQFNLTIIFISHDLSLLKHLSNRIIVMYLGHIMEISDDPEELYHHPKHPYTQALLSAISVPDPRIERQKSQKLLEGEIPSPLHPPKGCAFSTRCSIADEYCRTNIPSLQELTDKTQAACFKVTKCSPD